MATRAARPVMMVRVATTPATHTTPAAATAVGTTDPALGRPVPSRPTVVTFGP
jgi:hypothetical protein